MVLEGGVVLPFGGPKGENDGGVNGGGGRGPGPGFWLDDRGGGPGFLLYDRGRNPCSWWWGGLCPRCFPLRVGCVPGLLAAGNEAEGAAARFQGKGESDWHCCVGYCTDVCVYVGGDFERGDREFKGLDTGVVCMWVGMVPVYVGGIGAN